MGHEDSEALLRDASKHKLWSWNIWKCAISCFSAQENVKHKEFGSPFFSKTSFASQILKSWNESLIQQNEMDLSLEPGLHKAALWQPRNTRPRSGNSIIYTCVPLATSRRWSINLESFWIKTRSRFASIIEFFMLFMHAFKLNHLFVSVFPWFCNIRE